MSAVEGHYNQWKGDVFTLHHLGGDAAQYLEIAPINFEGFNKVSLRFEAVPFIGPTKPDAMVHFNVVTNGDGARPADGDLVGSRSTVVWDLANLVSSGQPIQNSGDRPIPGSSSPPRGLPCCSTGTR